MSKLPAYDVAIGEVSELSKPIRCHGIKMREGAIVHFLNESDNEIKRLTKEVTDLKKEVHDTHKYYQLQCEDEGGK